MTANPWSKFFWNDWDTDPNLRLCSMAAQGLWMRLLCMAARSGGNVLLNGRQPTPEQLARLYGETPENIAAWLDELEWNGVFSRDKHGTIYSRRMLRDMKKRQTAVENGKTGGNPALCKDKGISASDNPPVNPAPGISQKPVANSQKPKAKSSSQRPDPASPDPPPPARSTEHVPSASSPPTTRNAAADPIEVGNRVLDIVGADPARWTGDFASVRAWLSWGADPELDIYPAIRQVLGRQRQRLGNPTWRPNRLSYFDAAVEEARQNRLKPPPAMDGGRKAPAVPPVEDEERWRKRLELHFWRWRDNPTSETPPWDDAWGPPPDDPGCRAPRHLIEEVRAAEPMLRRAVAGVA